MFIENHRVTRSDVNQKILAACAYHKQLEEQDWISQLRTNCLTQRQQQSTSLIQSNNYRLQQSLMSTIDTIMDALGTYAVVFNQDADFDLYLSVTAPAFISEAPTEKKESKINASYSGRISSRRWSLVVSSKNDSIQFLLLHSSQLLHLSTTEQIVEPILQIQAVLKDHVVYWHYNDELLLTAELSKACQEAFRILIETIYETPAAPSPPKRNLDLPSATSEFESALKQLLENDNSKNEIDPIPHLEIANAISTTSSAVAGRRKSKSFTETVFELLSEQEDENCNGEDVAIDRLDDVDELDSWIRSILAIDNKKSVQKDQRAEHEELEPGSEEHEVLQFLAQLSLTANSVPSIPLINGSFSNRSISPQAIYTGNMIQAGPQAQKTTIKLRTIIDNSLNEIINTEKQELDLAARNGADAFESDSFEKAHLCLKEALCHKRVIAMMEGVQAQWNGTGSLEDLIIEYENELDAAAAPIELNLDQFNSHKRLSMAVELLMQQMMQAGAHAFQQLNLEQVHKICKRTAPLQRFQRRIDELCGNADTAFYRNSELQNLADDSNSIQEIEQSKESRLVVAAA